VRIFGGKILTFLKGSVFELPSLGKKNKPEAENGKEKFTTLPFQLFKICLGIFGGERKRFFGIFPVFFEYELNFLLLKH